MVHEFFAYCWVGKTIEGSALSVLGRLGLSFASIQSLRRQVFLTFALTLTNKKAAK